jgi:hypothetical protein
LQHEVCQLAFRVVLGIVLIEDGVVPVVAADKIGGSEGRPGPRGEDHAASVSLIDVERAVGIAADNLVGLAAADEVVVAGVEGKQDADAPLLIGLEQEDEPVGGGPELDLGVLTPAVLATVIE